MPTHVALLRGINVGGRNRVGMSDLRGVVEALGHTDVATYIQSGNVAFTTRKKDTVRLAVELEKAIDDTLGVRPRVVVLSRDELAKVVDDNPYSEEPNLKLVHAMFFGADVGSDLAKSVAAAQRQAAQKGSRDTAQVVGRTVYMHTPDGYGRSELAPLIAQVGGAAAAGGRSAGGKSAAASGGRSAAGSGTARNWATVTKLLAMCDT